MTAVVQDQGYLATFRPPDIAFDRITPVPAPLKVLWAHLARHENREAVAESRRLLREKALRNREALAALLTGAAAAELRVGNAQEANRMAKKSQTIVADQWIAHRIRIAAYDMLQTPERAYRYASSVQFPTDCPAWDEALNFADYHVYVASIGWRVGVWDDVAARIARAYPAGVASMPEALQSDWFRLAFYRNNSAEAASAARAILPACTVDQLDTLLNAMVQHGWTSEALPLYRDAFARHAGSQLLRRRLVGLCIREGALDEARELASAGALNILV